jgi:subtilisin family serine protease
MLRYFLCALCLALASVFPAAIATAQDTFRHAQSDRPRILVMIRIGPDHFRSDSSYGGDYGDAMSQEARLRFARRLAHDHRMTLVYHWPMQIVGVDCIIMSVSDKRTAQQAADEVSSVRGVEWSQPLNEFEMLGSASSGFNDRLSGAQPVISQWHLSSLHRFATGRGQTIAIVDSRIDIDHPDFAGQIIGIEDFVPGNLTHGERHGTGIAGIIAARANNAVGIAGIAPGAHILGLRACWERTVGGATVCDSLSLAKAMTYAVEYHADIVNLSLAGPNDRLLSLLIGRGLAQGMTVVAAVDESHTAQSFPSSLVGVLAVGDERLSVHGRNVYMAPGRDIPTTEPEGKWSLVSGSSYAAAHVSGLMALLRQLSAGRRIGESAAAAMGPHGTIDACAALARVSHLDAVACRSHN